MKTSHKIGAGLVGLTALCGMTTTYALLGTTGHAVGQTIPGIPYFATNLSTGVQEGRAYVKTLQPGDWSGSTAPAPAAPKP